VGIQPNRGRIDDRRNPGGLQAKALSTSFAPPTLIAVGACYLVVVAGLIAYAHKRYPREAGDRAVTPVGLFTIVRESRLVRQPYLQILAGIAVTNALATLFIDFQFYGSAIKSGSNNAAFFANFYIILNTASLGLQLFIAPPIQSKIGVAGSLLILPASLLGLSAFGFSGSLLRRSAVKVAEGGLKSAIHRSAWEQAFLPIETDCRGFGKIVVEGLSARLAEGFGSVALLIWMTYTAFDATNPDLTWVTIGSIFFLLLWVILTRTMARWEPESDSVAFAPIHT
jgi:ATP/ADP translocase